MLHSSYTNRTTPVPVPTGREFPFNTEHKLEIKIEHKGIMLLLFTDIAETIQKGWKRQKRSATYS